jgi:hypothetical protein
LFLFSSPRLMAFSLSGFTFGTLRLAAMLI